MAEGTPIESIRDFWNEKAQAHEEDLSATSPDPIAKDLEIAAIVRALDPRQDVLEMGCGNGFNLFALSESFQGRLVGMDFAPAMIEAARARACKHAVPERFAFHVGSILDELGFLGRFQQIFTDRCLINLTSLDQQITAVENLATLLERGGRLVLVESTQQGQEKINELRQAVGLERIPYHWHNLYLDEPAFLARIPSWLEQVATDNFASLYFIASRVFNAKLTPEGQSPDYLAPINKIAAQLPSIGDCAPLKLFAFRKAEK